MRLQWDYVCHHRKGLDSRAPTDPERPKRGRPKARDSERLQHVVQLRLNHRQRTYALLRAEDEGCSLGEAIRRCVEEAIDADPRTFEMGEGGSVLSMRQVLGIVSPDDGWLTERIAELKVSDE